MIHENQNKFEQLLNELKQLFPDTTTSVKIVITAENTKIFQSFRYPEQLKKQNISMRNIKGDFIKDLPTNS